MAERDRRGRADGARLWSQAMIYATAACDFVTLSQPRFTHEEYGPVVRCHGSDWAVIYRCVLFSLGHLIPDRSDPPSPESIR